jgi:hypothetical protein
MVPIIVTKEQARLILRLPKNTREWKSIWRSALSRNNFDPVTIERIINGEKYEVNK